MSGQISKVPRAVWKQLDEFMCCSYRNRKWLFLSGFSPTDQTPKDWELRLGAISARLSWYGQAPNGCWAVNFPLIDKEEWRLTELSSSSQAKIFAENYVMNELLVFKEMVDEALDCFLHHSI